MQRAERERCAAGSVCHRMMCDDIVYVNIEDVPVVKDPFVGTPLFEPTTENVVNARDREDDSE